MAWVERNGKRYYYRKQRRGAHVVSEYIGSGWVAELVADQDEESRAEREAQRKTWKQMRAQVRRAEGDLNQLQDFTRLLTRAALLAAGYHPHNWQWRKGQDER